MKKALLIGTVALAGLALTSCNDTKTVYSDVKNYPIPTYNLFTDVNGQAAPFVNIGTYTYTIKMPENTISAYVSGMTAPGGGQITFQTAEVALKADMIEMDNNKMAEAISFKTNDIQGNPNVTDVNCLLTQAAYAPGDVKIEGYSRFLPSETQHFTVMSYKWSNWLVRTFWPDMTFKGRTTTTIPGQADPFQTGNILYRVIMQRDDTNALNGKADVIMYNALFTDKMPEITVVIKDLKLDFTPGGYEITGTDVVPYMVEAGALQEAPTHKFNSISLSVTGDLTAMMATYTVANVFQGRFAGSSIKR